MPYEIEIVKGDITQTNTDIIVNAANNEFWMGAGVAGAIKRSGGDVIEREAMDKGPVLPGQAVFTGAGKLPFKYIIHAAVMGQDLKTSDRLIRQATVASLNIAEKLGAASLAFPAFGTGVGGFPLKACARLMIAVVRGFQSGSQKIKRVQFCLFDDLSYETFNRVLAEEK
ncbi:MAG: macro domain-containing protein [Candidatus Zixiibacteriota bacterium]